MSTLTMVETKKEATPAMTSRHSVTPQRHFELPRQANPAADGEVFNTTPTEPGFGYDFGRIPVHAPSLTSGDGTTQRAAQSCPLAASPRAFPFGGACHTCPVQVQAKLAISQPDDVYEQEADRVADQVIRMPAPTINGSQPDMAAASVQTKQSLQRSAEGTPEIDDDLESRLSQSRGGGSPLPDDVRAFMEPRFGLNFSQIRVHTGSEALKMNRALAAQAFTRGTDIYFAAGKYEPGSITGKHLLAHELMHVVQQTGGVQAQRLSQPSAVQMKCASCEAEEEIQRSIDTSSAPEIVQRQEEAAEEEGGYTTAEPEGGYTPAGAPTEVPSPEPLDKPRLPKPNKAPSCDEVCGEKDKCIQEPGEQCSQDVTNAVKSAWQEVANNITTAINHFDNTPDSGALRQSLRANFNWSKGSNPANLPNIVRGALDTAFTKFSDNLCIKCRDCRPVTATAHIEQARGQNCLGFNCFVICPKFKDLGADGQAHALLHELFHRVVSGAVEDLYRGQPGYPGPPTMALKMPDPYASLVDDLVAAGVAATPAPVPAPSGSSPAPAP